MADFISKDEADLAAAAMADYSKDHDAGAEQLADAEMDDDEAVAVPSEPKTAPSSAGGYDDADGGSTPTPTGVVVDSAGATAAATGVATTSVAVNNARHSNKGGAVAAATPSKERHSLTLDQRRALRRWANTQMVRPSHKACIEWFASEYGLSISQSTVSHSLSPKYARLDNDSQLSGSRLRFGNWPDVEKLVLLWHSEMVNRGRQPSNEELVQKAVAIFEQLPRYEGEKAPNFSPGWVHRFKKRYGLLMRRQRRAVPGPSGSAGTDELDDISYLVDALPRFMPVSADTPAATIRDLFSRVVGIDTSVATCARVRDEVVSIQAAATAAAPIPQNMTIAAAAVAAANPSLSAGPAPSHGGAGDIGGVIGGGSSAQASSSSQIDLGDEDDAEVALQNALCQIQQEETDADADTAMPEDDGDHHIEDNGISGSRNVVAAPNGGDYGQQQLQQAQATPIPQQQPHQQQQQQPRQHQHQHPQPQPPPQPPSQSQSQPHPHQHQQQHHLHHHQQPLPASTQPPALPPPPPPPPSQQHLSTPTSIRMHQLPITTPQFAHDSELKLTPIPSSVPTPASGEKPVRCPFCINTRMLRSIKEAVEHLSTHVVVE